MVVLAVPDQIAQEIIKIKHAISSATKILDCSTAHRTDPQWVYGLSEIKGQTEPIQTAESVSNPGCHATAAILSMLPLINSGVTSPKMPIITSITGHSGGGKDMINTYQKDPLIPPSQYAIGIKHKHVSEIEQFGKCQNPIFQPEVVNSFQGLKTNTFLDLSPSGLSLSQNELINIFESYYAKKPTIDIKPIPQKSNISMGEKTGTNEVAIYLQKHETKIQVIAVLDNLGKGSAGAAIQNIKLMLGLNS